jgi:hypothetical protein
LGCRISFRTKSCLNLWWRNRKTRVCLRCVDRGVTAIGVKYGANKPVSAERELGYLLTLKFYNQFEEKCGGVTCRELIGYDLTNEKEFKRAKDADVFNVKCVNFIKNAVEILLDLNEKPK